MLERDPMIAEAIPLLPEALPHIAHPQIRNRGTLGGNLAHADPASELPAIVLALEGRLRSQSTSGERWLSTPTSARSLPSRSSTSRTLRGRPTLIGTTDMGKSTEFRSGRMGTLSVSPGGGGRGGGVPVGIPPP